MRHGEELVPALRGVLHAYAFCVALVAAAHRGPLAGLADHLLAELPLAQGALRDDIARLAAERDILPDPG